MQEIVKAGALKKDFKIPLCAHACSYAGYLEAISLFEKKIELSFDKNALYKVLSVKDSQAILEVILP